MNYTNFIHAAYALLIQGVIGLVTGNWFAGACAGIAFFVGREHAQQEVSLGKPIASLKPWEGFMGWNRDRILDVVFPMIAVALFTTLSS